MAQDQPQASPAGARARCPRIARARAPGPQARPRPLRRLATPPRGARRAGSFCRAIVLAALGYGAHLGYDWFVEGRFIVSTDDAYVGADTAIIAAKVAGHITEVQSSHNQAVHAGDLLVRIDDGDYKLAVDAAKAKIDTQDATIARIGRQVEAQKRRDRAGGGADRRGRARNARAPRPTSSAPRSNSTARRSSRRPASARSSGSNRRPPTRRAPPPLSPAPKAAQASAEAALAGAKANLDVLQAQKVEAERTRAELVTAEEKAERDLSFTEIRAPFDGVVGNKAVELGQYAQPGVRLFALVALDSVYVDANFKETQLDAIRPGQKVDVAVDAIGGRSVPGVVNSISPASGAQFSLLPPDNATGNFTKVVQRVAVRITLDPRRSRTTRCGPGLSVVATVHTRDESLPKPTLSACSASARRPRRSNRQPSRERGRRRVPGVVGAARSAAGLAPPPTSRSTSAGSLAFIFMVFGMFMAILDIQIVSASLSQIQAGLSASQDEVTWVQTSYLVAEVIMIPLSGFLSRVFSTRIIFTISAGGLHADEPDVLDRDLDRRHDHLARAAGLHRRRHDPDRVRLGLHDLSALEAADRRADHRPGRDARADHRPDRRRLSHRSVLLALAVSGQHPPGDHGDGRRLVADRLRQVGLFAADALRLDRPGRDGRVSRRDRICAGGRALEGLVGERAGHLCDRRLRTGSGRVLLARVHRASADRRSRPPFATAISGPARCSRSSWASASTA